MSTKGNFARRTTVSRVTSIERGSYSSRVIDGGRCCSLRRTWAEAGTAHTDAASRASRTMGCRRGLMGRVLSSVGDGEDLQCPAARSAASPSGTRRCPRDPAPPSHLEPRPLSILAHVEPPRRPPTLYSRLWRAVGRVHHRVLGQ